MSLISINNFIAPFKNTTHVITIILVAMLVAAFRYSGGTVQINSNGRNVRGVIAPPDADMLADGDDQQGAPVASRKQIIDQIVGQDKDKDSNPGWKKDYLELQKKFGAR